MSAPASRIARSGFAGWFAVTGGIVAWIVHLTFAASIVRLACDHPGWIVVLHLTTALTAAVTLAAMGVAALLVRGNPDPESAETSGGQLRFLGLLGLLVGAVNLALILLEGSFAIFLKPCA